MRFKINTLKQALVGLALLYAFLGNAQSCIGFSDLPTGTYSVLGGYPLGTPFHTEHNIPVSLAAYHNANGGIKNNVNVQAAALYWSGLFLSLIHI